METKTACPHCEYIRKKRAWQEKERVEKEASTSTGLPGHYGRMADLAFYRAHSGSSCRAGVASCRKWSPR